MMGDKFNKNSSCDQYWYCIKQCGKVCPNKDLYDGLCTECFEQKNNNILSANVPDQDKKNNDLGEDSSNVFHSNTDHSNMGLVDDFSNTSLTNKSVGCYPDQDSKNLVSNAKNFSTNDLDLNNSSFTFNTINENNVDKFTECQSSAISNTSFTNDINKKINTAHIPLNIKKNTSGADMIKSFLGKDYISPSISNKNMGFKTKICNIADKNNDFQCSSPKKNNFNTGVQSNQNENINESTNFCNNYSQNNFFNPNNFSKTNNIDKLTKYPNNNLSKFTSDKLPSINLSNEFENTFSTDSYSKFNMSNFDTNSNIKPDIYSDKLSKSENNSSSLHMKYVAPGGNYKTAKPFSLRGRYISSNFDSNNNSLSNTDGGKNSDVDNFYERSKTSSESHPQGSKISAVLGFKNRNPNINSFNLNNISNGKNMNSFHQSSTNQFSNYNQNLYSGGLSNKQSVEGPLNVKSPVLSTSLDKLGNNQMTQSFNSKFERNKLGSSSFSYNHNFPQNKMGYNPIFSLVDKSNKEHLFSSDNKSLFSSKNNEDNFSSAGDDNFLSPAVNEKLNFPFNNYSDSTTHSKKFENKFLNTELLNNIDHESKPTLSFSKHDYLQPECNNIISSTTIDSHKSYDAFNNVNSANLNKKNFTIPINVCDNINVSNNNTYANNKNTLPNKYASYELISTNNFKTIGSSNIISEISKTSDIKANIIDSVDFDCSDKQFNIELNDSNSCFDFKSDKVIKFNSQYSKTDNYETNGVIDNFDSHDNDFVSSFSKSDKISCVKRDPNIVLSTNLSCNEVNKLNSFKTNSIYNINDDKTLDFDVDNNEPADSCNSQFDGEYLSYNSPKHDISDQHQILNIKENTEIDKSKCAICSDLLSSKVFTCKCGKTFCINHYQPELHNCDFDFFPDNNIKTEKNIKMTSDSDNA